MIKGSKVDVLKSCKNEITELLGIFVVTIIDKFHEKKIIHEKLTFWMAHHLFRSCSCAMEHLFNLHIFCNISWLSWQLNSEEEIWHVE